MSDCSVAYTISLASALLVMLVGFNAAIRDSRQTLLNCETTIESNSDFFEVEHSANGKGWRVVGIGKSHGTSEALRKYDFLHAEISGTRITIVYARSTPADRLRSAKSLCWNLALAGESGFIPPCYRCDQDR